MNHLPQSEELASRKRCDRDRDRFEPRRDSLDRLGGEDWWLRAQAPAELDRYLAVKGSVAIDGISLTLARVESAFVEVAVIPHTYHNTTLASLRAGARLNIECDILAKYVEKLLGASAASSGLTEEKLREMGY